MQIKFKTTPYPSGIIEQELLPEDNDIGFRYTKWVVDTREAAIKEALIALGWKPPNTQIHTDAFECKECGYDGDMTCPVCGSKVEPGDPRHYFYRRKA